MCRVGRNVSSFLTEACGQNIFKTLVWMRFILCPLLLGAKQREVRKASGLHSGSRDSTPRCAPGSDAGAALSGRNKEAQQARGA